MPFINTNTTQGNICSQAQVDLVRDNSMKVKQSTPMISTKYQLPYTKDSCLQKSWSLEHDFPIHVHPII